MSEGFVDTAFDAAAAALRHGRYAEGWALYEGRGQRLRAPPNRCRLPEWDGEPVESLLAWGEQGIGDEVQFARFIPHLRARGIRVVVASMAVNIRLFLQVGAEAAFDRLGIHPVPDVDAWVMLGSLPHRLGIASEAQLCGAPYLAAPNPYPAPRGVGIMWRGQPLHWNDANRSMPSPDLLLSIPGARVLEPRGDTLDSLDQLCALEALVTVDTSWAHLAGAMGLPTHVLLPTIDPDWRWGIGRSDSPWYGSVTVHRQTTPGDWEPVVRAARNALGL